MDTMDMAMMLLDALLRAYLLVGFFLALVSTALMLIARKRYDIDLLVYIIGFFKVMFTWPGVISDFIAYRRTKKKWGKYNISTGRIDNEEDK